MEVVVSDVEVFESGFGNFKAFGVLVSVDVASNGQTGFGFCRGDQLDNNLMAEKRSAPPVDADEREHAVFDAVPLAGAGR